MKPIFLLLFPLLFLAAKCDQEKFTTGQTVSLAPGQTAICSDCGNLPITFIDITEDSRCPRYVNCIQAGQAQVLIGIGKDAATRITLTLTGDPKAQSDTQTVGDYKIQALALDPYPEDGKTTEKENHRLQLVVTPK